jgi:ribosomal protein RSM22 (predicted rRNA methylase)
LASELPQAIRAAIAAMLEGVPRTDLAVRAARLSEAYRGGSGSNAVIASRADVLAYLVARMPATYAAVAAALAAARAALPAFWPERLLDVGAGPGTASFAALETWPALASVTMIDPSRQLLAAAGDLAAASHRPALGGSQRILGDALRLGRDLPAADLVVAAYVLAEAGPALVPALWKATAGALAIVEPGTPAGYTRIRDARAELIRAGAMIAAPCPHELRCPIVEPDWCHFAVRLARSRDHRLVKAAEAPFEDEKFSYVVAVRPPVELAARRARVLAPPRAQKAGILLKLCREDGSIAETLVERRDRSGFASARRKRWGDTFP